MQLVNMKKNYNCETFNEKSSKKWFGYFWFLNHSLRWFLKVPPKDWFAHRLNVLRKEVETSKKKLNIRRAVIEESKARVMQGEISFQDVELELWKVESDLDVVKKEIGEVENEIKTIHTQVQKMEKGGGVFF